MEIKPYQVDWTEIDGQTNALGVIRPKQSIKKLQPYYRSKAFVSQVGINPLTTGAAPLFYLVEKLQFLENSPELNKLHEDLIHELKAFENQAQSHGYRSNFILAARLVLSQWIDETILRTRWGRESDWSQYPLTDMVQNEATETKSFFLILNHCLQDPVTYIDLLELMYLCLSLGFEGEYRYLDRGYIKLAEIRDTLFHTISRQRGEVFKQLEITSTHEVTPENFLPRLMTRLALICVTAGIIIASYSLLNHQLTTHLDATNSNLQHWSTL